MSETVNAKPDVECEICDLTSMAQLTAKLADDLNQFEILPGEKGKGLWLGQDECELLLFAIYQTEKRAKALRTLYCGC